MRQKYICSSLFPQCELIENNELGRQKLSSIILSCGLSLLSLPSPSLSHTHPLLCPLSPTLSSFSSSYPLFSPSLTFFPCLRRLSHWPEHPSPTKVVDIPRLSLVVFGFSAAFFNSVCSSVSFSRFRHPFFRSPPFLLSDLISLMAMWHCDKTE